MGGDLAALDFGKVCVDTDLQKKSCSSEPISFNYY